MLVDAQVRKQVMALAEAVDDDVLASLAEVISSGARRRRVFVVKVAVAGALVLLTLGITTTAPWKHMEERRQQQPVEETDRVDPPPPADDLDLPERKVKVQDLDAQRRGRLAEKEVGGRSSGRPAGGGGDVQSAVPIEGGKKRPANDRQDGATPVPGTKGGDEKGPAQSMPSRPEGEVPKGSSHPQVSHREQSAYQMPVVRPKVDRRSSCTVFGEGCAWFEPQEHDRFARVSVHDDSRAAVLVHVTQWDGYGRTIGRRLTYCGGTSETFEVFDNAASLQVEIENGSCESDAPEAVGGRVEVVFFE